MEGNVSKLTKTELSVTFVSSIGNSHTKREVHH